MLSRGLLFVVVVSVVSIPVGADAGEPVASLRQLPTGNGHGFQVFNIDDNAVSQFLERPYRYLRANPSNPDGEGIIRRNLVFDAYFGIRVGAGATWLGKVSPDEVGYVDQSNVIRSMTRVGSVKTESFFFAPYGYAGNAMIMLLRVENEGSTAANVNAFSLANFHMGSAPVPDSPQANGESIVWSASDSVAVETGPGGGAMIYIPIGGADQSSCASGVWQSVADGNDITTQPSCTGDDRVNVFQKNMGSMAAGEVEWWGTVVLFDGDANSTAARTSWQTFANSRTAEQIYTDTLAEWEAWRTPAPGGLSNAERRVWRQGEVVLRMGQVLEPFSENPKRKGHGMVLASLPPGGWHSGWVRDAVYGIVAMARIGHFEEARWALDFFLNAEAGLFSSFFDGMDYRVSTVRYYGNGVEEADFSGQPTRNIEIDGWGLVLWAARVYVDASGDTAWLDSVTKKGDTVYAALTGGIADPLVASMEPNGMAIADASIWEVHWGNRQHFLYTTASAARGLCDMAALARVKGDTSKRDLYKGVSEAAVQAIRTHFVDRNNELAGSLERLAQGSNYRDGAVVEAFTWNLIPADDPIALATMNGFSNLRTPAGGYKRVEGSQDQYDSDEWILIDLRASDVWRRIGNDPKADELLDWVVAQAAVNYDLIPELYNTRTQSGQIGAYSGSIPMVGYGPGAYMLTALHRAGSYPYTDCGTEDPASRPDAGPSIFVDGGPEDPDAGEAGVNGRSGTACFCSGGSPASGDFVLLSLCALALLWRRRRRVC